MQRVRDLLGDSAPYLPEMRQPPRHKTDPAVVAAAERDRAERKRFEEERAKKLAATAVEGRSADPRATAS